MYWASEVLAAAVTLGQFLRKCERPLAWKPGRNFYVGGSGKTIARRLTVGARQSGDRARVIAPGRVEHPDQLRSVTLNQPAPSIRFTSTPTMTASQTNPAAQPSNGSAPVVNHEEHQYLDLVREILDSGERRPDR